MKKKPEEKLKKFSEQQLTIPEQLSLFSLLNENKDDYSQSVRLYDLIPKYFVGRPDLIDGRFLDSIEREFVIGKKRYNVRVTPARIKDEEGKDRDAYLGKREEVVEDALRKMAADGRRAKAVYLDGQFGVLFTRKSLSDELSEQGHSYSYDQIEQALEVMFGSGVELNEEGTDGIIKFHTIEGYGIRGKNGEDATYVKFNPLVTESIQHNAFRLINYKKLMSFKTVIARRLHKRMSHMFTQASDNETYHFSLNSIYRDFGLSPNLPVRVRVGEAIKGLEELKLANVIVSYSQKTVFDTMRRNKKVDYIFEIIPHQEFIEDVIKANTDFKRRENQLKVQKYLPEIYKNNY